MSSEVLRRLWATLPQPAGRHWLPSAKYHSYTSACKQRIPICPLHARALSSLSRPAHCSALSQRALTAYRLLLRAATPPKVDPANPAPTATELLQLRNRTRYNIQLVYRCRQHEQDRSRIERWLDEADTMRAFLTHFHAASPDVYADFFRRPNPQETKAHTAREAIAPPPQTKRDTFPSSTTLSNHLRGLHDRAYISLIPLLIASTTPPNSFPTAPSLDTSDALSTASTLPQPPPLPFPVALSGYSSPWLDWLRSTRPVSFTIAALEWLHTTTGSPWWLTLVLAGVIVRTALLPAVIYQQRVVHEISRLQQHFAYIRMLAAQSQLSRPRKLYEMARMRWALYWKYSCHPIKLLIPGLLQLSALICVAVSIRPLLVQSAELRTGGFGWVMDLSDYDPYYALPIAITALQYIFLHYTERQAAILNARRLATHTGPASFTAALTAPAKPTTPTQILAARFSHWRGGFIILLLPVIATLPAGLFVFQLTTLGYQLVQTAVLGNVGVRRALGLESGMRSIWKRREESTEEEIKEFDRLKAAMRKRMGDAAGAGADGAVGGVQEVTVEGEVVERTPVQPAVVFSSKSAAKRASATKSR